MYIVLMDLWEREINLSSLDDFISILSDIPDSIHDEIYSIINNEASFNFDVYDLNICEDDEDFIIRSAIEYIDSYKDVFLISSIVLANDYKKLGLLFNNGFEISQTSYLPVSEKGYKKTYVLKRSI